MSGSHDRGGGGTPGRTGARVATRVVQVVADAEGQAPETLPPIQESIDADALERLVSHRTSTGVRLIEFEYLGYRVLVDDSGEIDLKQGKVDREQHRGRRSCTD